MNIKDIITLNDNNEYVVVSKTNYDDKSYVYLVDINSPENFKFCLERKENEIYALDEIEEAAMIQKLLPLFYESSKSLMSELDSSN